MNLPILYIIIMVYSSHFFRQIHFRVSLHFRIQCISIWYIHICRFLVNVRICYRISLLAVSVSCVAFTLGLVGYVYQHRKIKVFKVASPIFLCITLLGCAIMYLEVRVIRSLWFLTSAPWISTSVEFHKEALVKQKLDFH